MKVSIIMCSYNSAGYAVKAVQCILDQTYKDWELIISDDRSSDNTAEVLQPYLSDPRISFHINEQNLGYVKNKNTALKKATGDLVTQLDCDDLCPPDRIEKQVKVFQENPEIMICGTGFKTIGVNDEPIEIADLGAAQLKHEKDFLISEPQLEYPFWFPGLMWRKELFNEIGYFSEYFVGIYGDDHHWTIMANNKYPIYFLKDILYYYRINPNSITNVYDDPRKLIAQDVIGELYRLNKETGTDWLQEGKPEEGLKFEQKLFENKQLMAQRYRMWAAKAIDKKNYSQASKLLKKHFGNSLSDKAGYRTLLYYLRSRYLK